MSVHASYDRDDVALQFLLHDLHGPALRALEEQLIADAELQERVAAIESELIHDYVAERLPADIRARFEAVYLTHAGRARKVEFARRLQGGLVAQPSTIPAARVRRTPAYFPIAVAAAAMVVFAAVLTWSVWPSHTRALASQRAVAVLRPGTARDLGPGQVATVPGDAASTAIDLVSPGDGWSRYRAVMITPDGDEVWRTDEVDESRHGDSTFLRLYFDARGLKDGDYILRLSARDGDDRWEDVADYAFRLRRAP